MRCDLILRDALILGGTGATRTRGDVGVVGPGFIDADTHDDRAVHKITGRPAGMFGVADRGVIRPGAYANLMLFNPDTMQNAADFEMPTRPSPGISEAWVNGRTAYTHAGRASSGRSGRLLTRHQD